MRKLYLKNKTGNESHVHLLVEGGHVFFVFLTPAGGAQHALEKGGGLHTGQVRPQFRELSIAENKQVEKCRLLLRCDSHSDNLRDITQHRDKLPESLFL